MILVRILATVAFVCGAMLVTLSLVAGLGRNMSQAVLGMLTLIFATLLQILFVLATRLPKNDPPADQFK